MKFPYMAWTLHVLRSMIKVFEVFSFLGKNKKYCLNEVEALTIVYNGFKRITT